MGPSVIRARDEVFNRKRSNGDGLQLRWRRGDNGQVGTKWFIGEQRFPNARRELFRVAVGVDGDPLQKPKGTDLFGGFLRLIAGRPVFDAPTNYLVYLVNKPIISG